jgi:putative ABC transport system permease protein
MSTLMSAAIDARQRLRVLARTPILTIAIVITFALGVGVNSTVLSLAHSVLLKPLPYRDPASLVAIEYTGAIATGTGTAVPSPVLLSWLARSRTLAALGAYSQGTMTLLSDDGAQRQLAAAWVSGGFFDVLGATSSMGRLFTDEDANSGHPVVVLSRGCWLSRFGGDEHVLGRALELRGRSYLVIGVTADGFWFPGSTQPDVFVPLKLSDAGVVVRFLHVMGRLAPAASPDRAERELASIDREESDRYPAAIHTSIANHAEPRVIPLQQQINGDLRTVLPVAAGVATCVLLLACVNVCCMMLARARGQRDEMRVRAALGASRGQLLRVVLIDQLLLGILGTSVAFLVVWWAVALLRGALAQFVLDPGTIVLDRWTLGATLAVSTLAGSLCAMFPAVRLINAGDIGCARRQDVVAWGRWARVRRWLVAGEVALALMLLVAGILLARTLWQLTGVDLGFEPSHVLTFRMSSSRGGYNEVARLQTIDDILAAVRSTPGVIAAGATTTLPLGAGAFRFAISVDGQPPPEPDTAPMAVDLVSPDYFTAIAARFTAGRTFSPSDTSRAPRVAIVNATFVREKMAGRDPIGRRIGLGGPPDMLIVGVIEDVRNENPRTRVSAQVFCPFTQSATQMGWHTAIVAVRTRSEPSSLLETIQRKVSTLGRQVALYDWTTLEEPLAASVAPERQRALLFGAFAMLATGLAACGVYGLVAYMVSLRLRELGIRVTLGATPAHVVGCVLYEGIASAAAGIAIGLAAAVGLARVLAGFLYGVPPIDAATYVSATGIIAVMTLLASIVPALRATRVDPRDILNKDSPSAI